jgi:hypothetical protein
MKLSTLIALAISLLAVSACVVEPLGYRGGGGGVVVYGGGGGHGDYGRRVWR